MNYMHETTRTVQKGLDIFLLFRECDEYQKSGTVSTILKIHVPCFQALGQCSALTIHEMPPLQCTSIDQYSPVIRGKLHTVQALNIEQHYSLAGYLQVYLADH